MVKKRWKKKGQSAPNIQADADPTTRSIALFGDLAAVAAGRRWRVVDIRAGKVLQDNTEHEGAVRGLAFSPDGQYLATCADDKVTCVWRTSDWACLHRLKSGKKATACTFSADSKHIFFSDRFGDVLCATSLPTAAAAADGSAGTDAAAAPAAVEGNLLLGHLQSIVTSLARCSSSTGQQLLVSTDKDGKVRASVLPADPVKGSYEILSYCLGHTKFVASAAAVPTQAAGAARPQHMVVSGSGDGTVRLWDVDNGKQLGCYVASEQPPPLSFQQQQQEAGMGSEQQQGREQGEGGEVEDGAEAGGEEDGQQQQQQQQQEVEEGNEQQAGDGDDAAAAGDANGTGKQEAAAATAAAGEQVALGGKHVHRYQKVREACCAVVAVAVSPDGSTVAAAVEGQQELQLLSLDAATGQLQLQQKLAISDVANPAAVVFDSAGRLWVVGGVLVRETESAHVGVAAKNAESGQWEVVTADVLPDGVRAALELRVQGEEERQQQQQQQEGYYFEGVKRAVYVVEPGSSRDNKRQRRDLRDIERLRALTAAKDQQKQQEQQQKGDADTADAARE